MNWLFQFRRHGLVFRRHGFFCRRHGLAIRRLGSTTWFFDDIDFDDLDIFFDDLVFRRVSIDPLVSLAEAHQNYVVCALLPDLRGSRRVVGLFGAIKNLEKIPVAGELPMGPHGMT